MTMWLITVKPSYVFGLRVISLAGPPMYNLLEDRKPLKGNTVGSRSSVEKAYIAGFLDGDGSIMLQIKKRADTIRGFRFMATICLYQDSRHNKSLYWIHDVLQAGYISKRNDGMTELRINGFNTVGEVLSEIQPYIRFKQLQAGAMIKACRILVSDIRKLSKDQLQEIVELMMIIQNENYVTHRKKSREELLKILGLTP